MKKCKYSANCSYPEYGCNMANKCREAYQQGIADFLSHLLNDFQFASLEDEIKIRNLFIGIAEQIKENKNE